jgi:hypothetical protein
MKPEQMRLLLAEIERAIRETRTWKRDTEQLRDHKAVVYSGQNLARDGEASGTWQVTVVEYPVPGGTHADGAASHTGQGLVIRLTAELSQLALKLAKERSRVNE